MLNHDVYRDKGKKRANVGQTNSQENGLTKENRRGFYNIIRVRERAKLLINYNTVLIVFNHHMYRDKGKQKGSQR